MTDLNIKLIIVGDSSVGKTSILLKYIDDIFPDHHVATIGVEYKNKIFEYRGFNIKLQIWDTAGQERFHSITKNFFHNADGIFFVYDITNNRTFKGVKNWIKEAEEVENSFEKILIGNKCDLIDEREVNPEEVEAYCKIKNITFYETSAKNNINLKEVFDKIVELILKDKTDEIIIKEFGIKNNSLSVDSSKKKKKNKKKNKSERCC